MTVAVQPFKAVSPSACAVTATPSSMLISGTRDTSIKVCSESLIVEPSQMCARNSELKCLCLCSDVDVKTACLYMYCSVLQVTLSPEYCFSRSSLSPALPACHSWSSQSMDMQ